MNSIEVKICLVVVLCVQQTIILREGSKRDCNAQVFKMLSIENCSMAKKEMKTIVIHLKLFLKCFAILIIFKDEMEFKKKNKNLL